MVKMAEDESNVKCAKHVYQNLCDLETLLGLASVVPLMEAIQSLTKFAQSRDVGISDFVAVVKQWHIQLYSLYMDPSIAFKGNEFSLYKDFTKIQWDTILMKWVNDLDTSEEHLVLTSSKICASIFATHAHIRSMKDVTPRSLE